MVECYTAEDFADAIDTSKHKNLLSSSAVERWFTNKSSPNKKHIGHLINFFVRNNICLKSDKDIVFKHFLNLLHLKKAQSRSSLDPSKNFTNRIYTVLSADKLVSAGWTLKEVVRQIFALDHDVYEDLTAENEGTIEQWMPVYKQFPQSWRAIAKERQLIGYWQFAVFLPDFYESVKQGKLMEGNIDPIECYDLFDIPGVYNMYIVSICLSEEFRNTVARQLLIDSFFDVLNELSKERVFFSEVMTNAYSVEGTSTCKAFRLTYYGPHCHSGKMYVGSMKGIFDRCSHILDDKWPELAMRYSNAGVN